MAMIRTSLRSVGRGVEVLDLHRADHAYRERADL